MFCLWWSGTNFFVVVARDLLMLHYKLYCIDGVCGWVLVGSAVWTVLRRWYSVDDAL